VGIEGGMVSFFNRGLRGKHFFLFRTLPFGEDSKIPPKFLASTLISIVKKQVTLALLFS